MWNLEHFVSSLVASCLGYLRGGLGLIAVAREAFPIPPSLLCICNHPHTTGGKKASLLLRVRIMGLHTVFGDSTDHEHSLVLQ